MKNIRGLLGFLSLISLAGIPAIGHADYVVTLEGQRIEGTITSVTKDEVYLNTKYGDLTFQIKNLTDYSPKQNSGAAASPPAGNTSSDFNNPFNNSGSGSTGAFGSGGSSNGGAFGSPAPSTGTNPFSSNATTNPFAPKTTTPSNSYGGNSYGAATSQPTSYSSEPQEKALSLSDLSPRPVVEVPDVPVAWNGVLFDIEVPEELSVTPSSSTRPSAENDADLYYLSRTTVTTGNTKARAALKDGVNFIRINPRSRYVLVEANPELSIIELNRGSLWFDMTSTSDGETVVIQTQTTEIIAKEKSVFRVSDALEQGIQVAVISGEVEVVSRVAQIRRALKADQTLLVQPEGSITNVSTSDIAIKYEKKGWETLDDDWYLTRSRSGGASRTLISRNELNKVIRGVSSAFQKYTKDTGHIPSDADGYSVLLENISGKPGWNGPYLEGVVPPIDCWGRPLRYTTRATEASERPIGVVYSLGADAQDNNGNPSADITEMVLFYQVVSSN